jgi:hypothetical protein
LQSSREWRIRFIGRCYSTHNIAIAVLDVLPSMRVARSTQSVRVTAMRTTVIKCLISLQDGPN